MRTAVPTCYAGTMLLLLVILMFITLGEAGVREGEAPLKGLANEIDEFFVKKMFLGIIGILISPWVVVLLWLIYSKWGWWRINKSGIRPHYVKTTHGWIERASCDKKRAKQVKREDPATLHFFWKTTKASYDWVWWDPSGLKKQQFDDQQSESFLRYLPKWMRSYPHGYLQDGVTKTSHPARIQPRENTSNSDDVCWLDGPGHFGAFMSGALQDPDEFATVRRNAHGIRPQIWAADSQAVSRATRSAVLISEEEGYLGPDLGTDVPLELAQSSLPYIRRAFSEPILVFAVLPPHELPHPSDHYQAQQKTDGLVLSSSPTIEGRSSALDAHQDPVNNETQLPNDLQDYEATDPIDEAMSLRTSSNQSHACSYDSQILPPIYVQQPVQASSEGNGNESGGSPERINQAPRQISASSTLDMPRMRASVLSPLPVNDSGSSRDLCTSQHPLHTFTTAGPTNSRHADDISPHLPPSQASIPLVPVPRRRSASVPNFSHRPPYHHQQRNISVQRSSSGYTPENTQTVQPLPYTRANTGNLGRVGSAAGVQDAGDGVNHGQAMTRATFNSGRDQSVVTARRFATMRNKAIGYRRTNAISPSHGGLNKMFETMRNNAIGHRRTNAVDLGQPTTRSALTGNSTLGHRRTNAVDLGRGEPIGRPATTGENNAIGHRRTNAVDLGRNFASMRTWAIGHRRSTTFDLSHNELMRIFGITENSANGHGYSLSSEDIRLD